VISDLFTLVTIAVLLLLIAAIMAPLESLGWWAGWHPDRRGPDPTPDEAAATPQAQAARQARYYVVYLSGVMTITGDAIGQKEANFLNQVEQRLADAVVVRDVFPYSATNNPLTGERLLGRLWNWIERLRLKGSAGILDNLVGVKNILQVAVSADQRYGPVYSFGVAQAIAEAVVLRGYRVGSGQLVLLMGLSGGGQIAVGVVPYLTRMLQGPVRVISIGGVLTDDPGILEVEHLYHLSGSADVIQHVGKVLFPGRWPLFTNSAWNQARQQGRITVIDVGPMRHLGYGDYFSRSARLPDGTSHVEKTADVIATAIMEP
jgi:hypothetical protein